MKELRSVQIGEDEMEMSDEDRDYQGRNAKRIRFDSESIKDENDSLRCQLAAIRNELALERTDLKLDSVEREKQIKVLQETIRNMQTKLLQIKLREQEDGKTIMQLEQSLKEAGVKQLLLKTKIKETSAKLRDKEAVSNSSINLETSEVLIDDEIDEEQFSTGSKAIRRTKDIIDIDAYKVDDDVRIIENASDVVEIHEIEDDENIMAPEQWKSAEIEFRTDQQLKLSVQSKKIISARGPKDRKEFGHLPLSDAKIIALTAAYLVLYPNGLSSANICNYLCEVIPSFTLDSIDVADILKRYPNIFKPNEFHQSDVKNTIVKWTFYGFTDDNQQAPGDQDTK